MPDETSTNQPPPRDLLLTRPDEEPLPTALDPAGPESRGGKTDPKPGPGNAASPGNPKATDPGGKDIGRVT